MFAKLEDNMYIKCIDSILRNKQQIKLETVDTGNQ